MSLDSMLENIDESGEDDYKRYCYVVTGTEINIVTVKSSRDKALFAAENHLKHSGVIDWEVIEVNDEYTYIMPKKYDTFEKVEILRYDIS